ncbi:MAG TPA: hypothetical protein DDW52_17140, partial [Planctomycetaceae bacterium]|nr:hypothetical protein [Planctomycetaceae bacterium]
MLVLRFLKQCLGVRSAGPALRVGLSSVLSIDSAAILFFTATLASLAGGHVKAADGPLLRISKAAAQGSPQTDDSTIVLVRGTYFDASQPIEAFTQPIILGQDTRELRLKKSDGIALQLACSDRQSLAITLEQTPAQLLESQGNLKNYELRSGNVGDTLPLGPLSIDLSRSDSKVIGDLQAGLSRASTGNVQIATSASIDRPCLEAFFEEAANRLGEFESRGQWIGYVSGPRARHIAGWLEFEKGTLWLEVSHQDAALVSIGCESEALRSVWLPGQIETEPYATGASELTRRVMAGKGSEAWQLFSPSYRESVTPQKLDELSDKLRAAYGKNLESLDVIATEFGNADLDNLLRPLDVYLAGQTDAKKTIVSRVRFTFSLDPERVPRGDLASIYIFESWRTAFPSRFETAQGLLAALRSTDVAIRETVDAADLPQLLDHDSFFDALISIRQALQASEAPAATSLDRWIVETAGNAARATGPVQPGLFLQLDFDQQQLVSVTLKGNQLESTLTAIAQPARFEQAAQNFWTSFLSNDTQAAYGMLIDEITENVTPESFAIIAATSGFGTVKEYQTSSVELGPEFGRESVCTYALATLIDGTVIPLRCRLRLTSDGRVRVSGYDTQFNHAVKVPVDEESRRLAEWFANANVKLILTLVPAESQHELDVAVFGRFLQHLSTMLGPEPQLRNL